MRLEPSRIAAAWHALIPTATGGALVLLDAVERVLARARVPELRWSETILRTRHLVPRTGVRALAIRHRNLREWVICVGVKHTGVYVAVDWYLLARPTWLGDVRRLFQAWTSQKERETVGSELNAHRRAQLGHLVALTREAVRQAIAENAEASGRTRRPRRRRRA